MESKSKGAAAKSTLFSRLTGSLSIRIKLMLAFFVMILLTLSVSAVTLISQTIANKTIEDLVNIHGTIARLSLETDKHLRMMQSYEKDFLIKYRTIGIQEAKDKYLSLFNQHGGQAYQTIYKIQQLSTNQADIDTAQTAIESINEYLSAFIGTVNILELRADKEFGELIKLEQSVSGLYATVETLDSMALSNAFFQLQNTLKDYLMTPTRDVAVGVIFERDNFLETVASLPFSEFEQDRLGKKTEEFTKWFTEVANTDEVITARIETYEKAAENAEPIIASFLKSSIRNESAARLQMEESTKLTQILVIAVGLVAVVLGIIIAFFLSRGLTRQIRHIVALFEQIGKGNYEARTKVVSNDELGSMATTLNAMLDNVTVLIQSQAERDAIQNSIMKLLEEISSLTDGDLTARAEVTEDMTGAIADSFNAMTDQLSDIIRKVKDATESVDDTSEEVSKQTMTLANRTIEQTQKVNQAIDAIEKMADSIKHVSENAQQSAEVSLASKLNAREGAEAVQRTNNAMNEIREEINETARSIKRLGESSMEIGNVIQIINDIADRTSILALNASIQAAMAGDAGHGFAVVADEVQRLAESSSNSTKQIEALVKNIQAEIKNVSTRMDESISKVVQGSQLADGAHAKLQEIEQVSNQLANLIESITAAAHEQVRVSEEITATMQEVGEVSTESSRSSQETATSMDMLSRTAHDLRAAVEMFKISDTARAV